MSAPRDKLSGAAARRVALAAQGFAERRPQGAVDARHARRVIARVGLVQIDSVNVLVRSHYLPFFSRLGAYRADLLDAEAYSRRRRLFEYWGHEASLMPVELQPLMRWRMQRAERGEGVYRQVARFAREHRPFLDAVLREIETRGPLAAGDLAAAGGARGKGGWWGWSEGKAALEYLFWSGRVTTATRRNFKRVYDLTERALPQAVVAQPTPDTADAQRELLRIAARALGVATERDLRDYFRLGVEETRARLAELVEAEELIPVAVEGWRQPAFLHPAARRPRRVEAAALLSPFDSLVWERDRAERLFGFRYRLEIYTPAHRRTHGYYVLPFLVGERIVARVDLKADRAAGFLRVEAAHAEAEAGPREIAAALAAELCTMASWLGLADVAVRRRGDLADALAAALPRADLR
ncbi:crosslink repair DNA glycosylase YcaQ family protein [Chelatococcus sp. SYSU_G07232]|uniref:Crosslink repair DNA glycosylase YcaQ family protein n=1 Tax=Chelatococcus albus TaxID=3047466 RepID=A0ABT7ALF4_9HYPH|nr:crosslink repair DNA glycosylase YcaQ family protein [Chelatococcus sp. SYSU_G07232]MDJ1160214.1 crosslink repair DNA glycosylase YcaQ family protein [Chelatococcus sp. SYSU_G07232]